MKSWSGVLVDLLEHNINQYLPAGIPLQSDVFIVYFMWLYFQNQVMLSLGSSSIEF